MFDPTSATVVSALTAHGLFDGLRLPERITQDIAHFAAKTPCFGNHDRNLDFLPSQHAAQQSFGNPITSGHYLERVNECAALMAVQADSLLQTVAERCLGRRARVISARLWWSFPAPAASAHGQEQSREMLHFDLDDWRMLKFFFYITPVDASSGPHLFMRGTHKHHVFKHQLSLTIGRPLEGVLATYGDDRLIEIYGEAGRDFAEDPFGFHAGALASAQSRLMLRSASV